MLFLDVGDIKVTVLPNFLVFFGSNKLLLTVVLQGVPEPMQSSHRIMATIRIQCCFHQISQFLQII